VTDESYRELISWAYQRKGNIVLYDRHYLFDFALIDIEAQTKKVRLSDRLHRWFITHMLAKPDMTIFLDAPPEVLYARKGEWGVEYLRERREAVLYQGEITPNFICVDARQSIEEVYEDVCKYIIQFYETETGRKFYGNNGKQ
jgi:thymidylate kinase